jgi:hypothetical protein
MSVKYYSYFPWKGGRHPMLLILIQIIILHVYMLFGYVLLLNQIKRFHYKFRAKRKFSGIIA